MRPFGKGHGTGYKVNFRCIGTEAALLNCSKKIFRSTCNTFYRDVGVTCGNYFSSTNEHFYDTF